MWVVNFIWTISDWLNYFYSKHNTSSEIKNKWCTNISFTLLEQYVIKIVRPDLKFVSFLCLQPPIFSDRKMKIKSSEMWRTYVVQFYWDGFTRLCCNPLHVETYMCESKITNDTDNRCLLHCESENRFVDQWKLRYSRAINKTCLLMKSSLINKTKDCEGHFKRMWWF